MNEYKKPIGKMNVEKPMPKRQLTEKEKYTLNVLNADKNVSVRKVK